jgi:hypothetical protein
MKLISVFFLMQLSVPVGAATTPATKKEMTQETLRKSFLELKALNDKNTDPRVECKDPFNVAPLEEVSILSLKDATKLFQDLASDSNVPFRFPEDGCYARAHYMARKMERKKIISAKVFIHGKYLHVNSSSSPSKEVFWGYHVAPVIKVRVGEKIEPMVIDPSLFDRPVPVKEWEKIQTRPPGRFSTAYYTRRFQYSVPAELSTKPEFYHPFDVSNMQSVLKTYKKFEKKRLERMKKAAK